MLVAERLEIVEKERKSRLFVKCWGADYKISQYNIFGYQNLSVSRSIKVYVF